MSPEEAKVLIEAVYGVLGIPVTATLGYFTLYIRIEHFVYFSIWSIFSFVTWRLLHIIRGMKDSFFEDVSNSAVYHIGTFICAFIFALNIINNIPTIVIPEKTAIVEMMNMVRR